jgi:hypothetical protein
MSYTTVTGDVLTRIAVALERIADAQERITPPPTVESDAAKADLLRQVRDL